MGVPVLTRHDHGCKYARERDGGHSDAAKRVSDHHNLHLTAAEGYRRHGVGNPHVGRVFACRLSDGTSDGVLYDSLADAVRGQRHNADWYAFLRVQPGGMTVCAAAALLRMHRLVHDAGGRMTGTDVPRVMIPRLTTEAFGRQVSALSRRDWIRGS
jgi:hypothetical protein